MRTRIWRRSLWTTSCSFPLDFSISFPASCRERFSVTVPLICAHTTTHIVIQWFCCSSGTSQRYSIQLGSEEFGGRISASGSLSCVWSLAWAVFYCVAGCIVPCEGQTFQCNKINDILLKWFNVLPDQCKFCVQPWPKVLRITQVFVSTKFATSVFFLLCVRCYYGKLKYNYN